jgi:hypothetical protein
VRWAGLERERELEQLLALAPPAPGEVAERQWASAWPGRVPPAAGLSAVRGQPALAQVHPARLAVPEQ